MDAPAPAARRSASGRAQMLNGLRKPSQLEIEQHDFILQQQQATIDQLASLQAQTQQIFAQMDLNGAHAPNNREAISNNMQNMTRTRRLSSNPPPTSANHRSNTPFKGRRPASLNLSALNTAAPIHEELHNAPLPHTAIHNSNQPHRNNNASKRKTYSNLGHLPPVPQSAPANAPNGRHSSFRVPSALNSANNAPQGCVRQPRGPPSENLEAVNFSSRQRKLASRRLSGLAGIAGARRRVSVAPTGDPIDASNGD
ncbi:hypothetical protein E3P92_02702 [Wallemia ichthyophaga]|uniref:Uncharacterized protein n=2 Tax=Wallemia ichthyophaga TaxID=245174 RepID=A0A4T0FGK1_WALIC|nr:uncharacterized protein J056_002494 [Wallemia ichthyophaga EXF-994]TIA79373.1 hypothetical protein E3P98_03336 [Wallemia ichthyophaga]EOQ99168.1 hypothetical protein J056_002494 [Wallemia ichthyophaga EXF-994]TIA87169.1 hypothetical protein E3P97_04047 [Wallemia ichthyophaga]TIA97479.1 hypothetical protein E3P94_03299 [Wallemia ichthyophaga]TIA98567.1 hypothetical protein E3P95_02406 [Wallemia ichthyophaga]